MRSFSPRALFVVWALAWSHAAAATEFYVSPTGAADGAGTIGSPMTLDAALSGPSAKPGDTIWLRGGTYRHSPSVWPGSFWCNLKGTASAPITVRQYPGERATVDGVGTLAAVVIGGNGDSAAHVVFRDLELTDSSAVRGQSRASGLWVRNSTDLHFINLVIHDVEQGVGFWVENTDSEVYGCLVYYNGSSNLSHGIYAGNLGPALKRIQDNIIFSNYGYGIHVYSSAGGAINNFLVEGNVSFENGKLKPLQAGASPNGANLLVGGETVAVSPQVIGNFTYFSAFAAGEVGDGQQLGYLAGCEKPIVRDNYFVGTTHWEKCTSGAAISGNTFYSFRAPGDGLDPAFSGANSFSSGRPQVSRVFVRPNRYEAGRANIVVYNWEQSPAVGIDVSAILKQGDEYEIRNAQDFFAGPIAAGTYSGQYVRIPMTGLSVATPRGLPAPGAPGPEFGAFVLLTTGTARTTPEIGRPPQPRPARTLIVAPKQ